MWGAGFGAGIGVGFAIGIIVGGLTAKQKSWSEFSDKEKKTRMWLVGVGILLMISGMVAFLLVG